MNGPIRSTFFRSPTERYKIVEKKIYNVQESKIFVVGTLTYLSFLCPYVSYLMTGPQGVVPEEVDIGSESAVSY